LDKENGVIPIWKLVEEAARELTENGISPFTRSNLIEYVQRKNASYGSDSINPIIQGLTDNLKGGAPGAVGKNMLHCVGRGLFLLSDNAKFTPRFFMTPLHHRNQQGISHKQNYLRSNKHQQTFYPKIR